ncbi:MAG TPA: uridine phosphorylase [Deltaproteobacteria bacterium]|nr:MAG: uridine phosphorylase [Deltaproteobacteria bacterium GWA2_55_82]OGQ64117.1 MAG: uridine phosphorylase [Deltaproteobacteria bacterium RIFCSPLOWO2_02_FULL_55_12]OIJ74569.1 MAG: uridine phosphorylase [Deltaproteobacteria bacterium GWC2_55_46]HBG46491.1 uridine phosphorylase [Deltaproteobacteria bacterium]HCY10703.1 uridine phosphorylase [Deltaproteobacteria bacterium]
MARVYHLDLDKKAIKGAKIALLPGDPKRSAVIAGAISKAYGARFAMIASKREFTTCLTEAMGQKVLVASTGIGGPSASIAVDELAQLGVTTFLRVGTTGAIQNGVKNGDCVITTGSVRLDGASTHYAPIEFPAVADFSVVASLISGARKAGVRFHLGITASSDTFYPGEERTDAFMKYKLRRFRGATAEWRALHVLNYEMESSTILTMTSAMGLRGGCITGVVNKGSTGKITPEALRIGEDSAVRAAVAALEFLKFPPFLKGDEGGL